MQRLLTLLKNVLLMPLKMLCQSAYAQLLPVHICFQGHLLTLSLLLHCQYFRGNSLASETPLNVDFHISKAFISKGWSMVMHGVSIFNLAACLQICCNTEYIAVRFDALRSTVRRSVKWLLIDQWLLIAYNQTSLVDGYRKNKHYAIINQGLTHCCFQESIINHSLSFSADRAETQAGIYYSIGIPLSLIILLTRFSFSFGIGILLHTGSSTWFLVVAIAIVLSPWWVFIPSSVHISRSVLSAIYWMNESGLGMV